ncbi:MAG: hypothetical protein ACXVZH_14435 [Terriglobales bacterium]
MKAIRNIVGTVGLLYASYVLISSMKDVRRYIKDEHDVREALCGTDTLVRRL